MSSVPKFIDRIMATSTTTGTGTYTLGSAIAGYQAWSVLGDGNSAYYVAEDVNANGVPTGDWEVGIGTYATSGTTLTRDTVLASSNAGSAVSWAAGTRRVSLTVPATATPPPEEALVSILPGSRPVTIQGSNLSTGDTDLYTCPTGKRCYVGQSITYNESGSNIPRVVKVKVSGSYYPLTTALTVNNGFQGTATVIGYVLEAGESLSVTTTVANGLNIIFEAVEFDATAPLKSVKVIGLTTGDNTIYTCPSGKRATLLPASCLLGGNLNRLSFVNDAGGSHSWYYHMVPSGQAVGSAYKFQSATAVSASTLSILGLAGQLAPGDFINVNISAGAATQIVWANLWERTTV